MTSIIDINNGNSWNVEATKSSLNTSAALDGLQDGRNRNLGDRIKYQTLDANLGRYGEKTEKVYNSSGDAFASGLFDPFNLGYGDKIVDLWGGTTEVTKGYDIVGIKGTMVEPMRESIRGYVESVQKVMNTALDAVPEEARKAFRGEEALVEINKYIEKVRAYCQNVISALLVFSDKLADVGNAWNAAQQNMATTISSTTGAFSEGSAYTEGVQYTGPASKAQYSGRDGNYTK